MLRDPLRGGRRIAPLEHPEERAVLPEEVGRAVLPDGRDEREADFRAEHLVGARQAGAPHPADERAVEVEVRIDHLVAGRFGRQPLEPLDDLLESRPGLRASGDDPGGLDLDERPHVVQVPHVVRGHDRDPDAAMRLTLEESEVHELHERGPQRLATDAVLLGELDLPQPGTGGERAIEDSAE